VSHRRRPDPRVVSLGARALDALPPKLQVRLSGRPPIVVDGQTLDPGVQLMLAIRDRLGEPPADRLSVADARAFTVYEARLAAGRRTEVKGVHELTVPGATGPLRARLYQTPEPAPGPHPLLVFIHGGGFVVGDLDTHDHPCRVLCRHAGVHVLSIEYRLGPEHPFPHYHDDVLASWRWAAEHAAELGADPARVAVGGDSAGGTLSIDVARAGAAGDVPAPALQVLLYPATDATERARSYELFADGFFLTTALIDWYTSHHWPEGADQRDPRRSPLLVEDLSGQAPAIVVTAGFDPLRDEGEAYARRLREAGVPVVLRRFESLFHGFINVGINRTSRAALTEVAGMVRALLAVGDDLDAAGGRERAGGLQHVGPAHRDPA
jgi:acetyl esterase